MQLAQNYPISVEKFENYVFSSKISHFGQKIQKLFVYLVITPLGRKYKNYVFSSKISHFGLKIRKLCIQLENTPFQSNNSKIMCLARKYPNLVEKFEYNVFSSKITHFGREIRNSYVLLENTRLWSKTRFTFFVCVSTYQSYLIVVIKRIIAIFTHAAKINKMLS